MELAGASAFNGTVILESFSTNSEITDGASGATLSSVQLSLDSSGLINLDNAGHNIQFVAASTVSGDITLVDSLDGVAIGTIGTNVGVRNNSIAGGNISITLSDPGNTLVVNPVTGTGGALRARTGSISVVTDQISISKNASQNFAVESLEGNVSIAPTTA